jgi:holin-like protein
MTGLAILLIFHFAGVVLHEFGGVPMPGNVLGMVLLFTALWSGVVKVEWVEGAAEFLLKHMMLFFAPIVVGVMPLMPVLAANVAPVVVGMVVSTLVTMVVTAWVAQALMRKEVADGG